ncbi:MAG: hypothetical protein B6D55_07545, partial [Candidatus Omnitrophica bacterium 4484_70.2]
MATGKSSIVILPKIISKEKAVKEFFASGIVRDIKDVIYCGNEVREGNDKVLTKVEGVTVVSCDVTSKGLPAEVVYAGKGPAGLEKFLEELNNLLEENEEISLSDAAKSIKRNKPEVFISNPNHNIIKTSEGLLSVGCLYGYTNIYTTKDTLPSVYILPVEFIQSDTNVVALAMVVFKNYTYGRKTKIIGTPKQIERIKDYLYACYYNDNYPSQIGEERYLDFMYQNRIEKERLELEDLVEFIPLKNGEAEIGRIKVIYGRESVKIIDGKNEYRVNMLNLKRLKINFKNIEKVKNIPDFGITILGADNSFEPHGLSTSYIIWVNQKGLLVDVGAFTLDILDALGISYEKIKFILLTHQHEDHDVGLISFLKLVEKRNRNYSQQQKVKIITSKEIWENIRRKLIVLYGDKETVERLISSTVELVLLKIGEEIYRIDDVSNLELNYAMHGVPSLMGRVNWGDKRISFSGDHCFNYYLYSRLFQEGRISSIRRRILEHFLFEETPSLIVHEMGARTPEILVHTHLSSILVLPSNLRKKIIGVHFSNKSVESREIIKGYCGLTIYVASALFT